MFFLPFLFQLFSYLFKLFSYLFVFFLGKETKISLNSKSPPSKLSTIDKIVNKTLLIAMLSMLIVCIFSMVSNVIWSSLNDEAKYLCLQETDIDTCENSSPSSILTVFTFATLYNNFVCISMYVSLEMVYLFQAYFIANDLRLYDKSTDTPAVVHNSGMCADLGQIQVIAYLFIIYFIFYSQIDV